LKFAAEDPEYFQFMLCTRAWFEWDDTEKQDLREKKMLVSSEDAIFSVFAKN
jgi:hypothetical protein